MSLRIAATLAVCVIACASLTARAQDQLPWVEDFAQACQQANAQGKLVLLHFYSDDCQPCVRVERNVFSQPEVGAAVGRNYVPVKIHALKNPGLASKYHVAQWPTDVFVKPSGEEIMRTVSPQTPTAYINLTNSVAAQAGTSATQNQNNANVAGAAPAAPAIPGLPTGQWLTSAQNTAAQVGNQTNAQATWMTASAAQQAQQYGQQAQQYGQQSWQTAQGQANQALTNGSQYAQQLQQQALAASNQAAQNVQQSTQAAAGQAQQVINQYAQPWQPAPAGQTPAAAGQAPAAGGWQAPFAAAVAGTAATTAPLQGQFTSTQPQPGYTAPPAPAAVPAAAGAPSPYEMSPSVAPPAAAAGTNYPIAMGGFCPVALATEKKWKKGQLQFGAVHRRRTFLFSTEADQKKFLAEPDKYTPVLVGYDPVKFMQTGELIDGSAAFSLTYRKEVYLFADDTSLKTFWQNPAQFTDGLRQAVNRTDSGRTLR